MAAEDSLFVCCLSRSGVTTPLLFSASSAFTPTFCCMSALTTSVQLSKLLTSNSCSHSDINPVHTGHSQKEPHHLELFQMPLFTATGDLLVYNPSTLTPKPSLHHLQLCATVPKSHTKAGVTKSLFHSWHFLHPLHSTWNLFFTYFLYFGQLSSTSAPAAECITPTNRCHDQEIVNSVHYFICVHIIIQDKLRILQDQLSGIFCLIGLWRYNKQTEQTFKPTNAPEMKAVL